MIVAVLDFENSEVHLTPYLGDPRLVEDYLQGIYGLDNIQWLLTTEEAVKDHRR